MSDEKKSIVDRVVDMVKSKRIEALFFVGLGFIIGTFFGGLIG